MTEPAGQGGFHRTLPGSAGSQDLLLPPLPAWSRSQSAVELLSPGTLPAAEGMLAMTRRSQRNRDLTLCNYGDLAGGSAILSSDRRRGPSGGGLRLRA